MMRAPNDRGAVAVEMALLLPVLVLLLLGIMEFGRAYNAQVALTNAARESVRVMAITNNVDDARAAAITAAAVLNPGLTDSDITPNPASCTSGVQATITITYELSSLTGIAGPFTMTGRGVMQCGG